MYAEVYCSYLNFRMFGVAFNLICTNIERSPNTSAARTAVRFPLFTVHVLLMVTHILTLSEGASHVGIDLDDT